MRYTICEEGNDWLPNQVIQPGALKWDDSKPIPIFPGNNDLGRPPIGWAEDLQRDEDSVITAEVAWIEDMLNLSPDGPLTSGIGLTVYARGVMSEEGGDWRRDGIIKEATLIGLFLAEVPWGEKRE